MNKYEPPDSVIEIVKACIEEAKGDNPAASRLLEARARADRHLYDAITGPYLDGACWNLICQEVRSERKVVWESTRADPIAQKGDRLPHLVKSAAQHVVEGLHMMSLPLPDLPRLGRCSKEQVLRAVAYYETHAADARIKGKFLQMIADRLREGDIVSAVIKEKELTKLRQQAES